MSEIATFDFTSEEANTDAYWDGLRRLQAIGPLVWVDSLGGYWAANSHQAVLKVAQDWETFSSGQDIALHRPDPETMPWIMPIETDPPRQRVYRRQRNPHFAPKILAAREDAIRAIADELIDRFVKDGSCDIAVDFARKFPRTVFFRLIVPCGDQDFQEAEPSASVIGVIMRSLAERPELPARVRAEPHLIPALIEECVRLEPPVPITFRTATRDVVFEGHHIRKRDRVGMFFGAANRDPTVFDRPYELDVDRRVNRHLAFGGGPHRCIGSNLARLQIRVAIEQLLARLRPFRIPGGATVVYKSMQARGPFSVPLEFEAAG